ncbi:phosphatidylserine decarboxylase [Maridesulfovibrio ferrireducens]|uniref:Phosphatidylserine decarboxylase n=1 Tax=Maridesulfovibrio ferrireducens TaxID=246191 RepID=A0A1G9LF40_9BACT|nr:phosphatidylserine decarboxylase [Maridesulfovibrio ferrireducens]SDL60558.1 phosphatidylserine decarboxylase [Maridesulfovibrio ferrireducens]
MKNSFRILASVFLFMVLLSISTISTAAAKISIPDDCPCKGSITNLIDAYNSDKVFKVHIDEAFKNMQPVPEGYRKGGNPWIGKSFADLIPFFVEWSSFLPEAKGSEDNALKYIEQMDLFAYKNPFGRVAFQTSPGVEIFNRFATERGEFLSSKASIKKVAKWLADPRIEKEEYVLPDPTAADGGFKSYNDFFSRKFKDISKVRPQTMPDRDYIISSPTDATVNSIPAKIVDGTTKFRTKGTQELNIKELLEGSRYWKKFVGGTALSCVLMPNTYHYYHAPVGGQVLETRLVDGALIGMEEFVKFAPAHGNVGAPGASFGAFESYARGYFIIDTGKYGLVGVIPVGLSTVGSVVFEDKFLKADGPVAIKRGDELGHFLYGGSLVILVFEPGQYGSDAIKVRLGNQIGIFDTSSNK